MSSMDIRDYHVINTSHAGKPFNALWPLTYLSQDTAFQFLSFLLHEECFELPTTALHYAAIKDPLYYGFQLTPDPFVL